MTQIFLSQFDAVLDALETMQAAQPEWVEHVLTERAAIRIDWEARKRRRQIDRPRND